MDLRDYAALGALLSGALVALTQIRALWRGPTDLRALARRVGELETRAAEAERRLDDWDARAAEAERRRAREQLEARIDRLAERIERAERTGRRALRDTPAYGGDRR